MATIDGIINEPSVNFVGRDGFFWWVGEVEDNEDPMELGRCKVRVLGYYTNVRGGTTADLPTKEIPWATVLQHTSQAGNDGQGESSGQLQPGAIVMGFFMDGESAQMPIVIGVLRVNKSPDSADKKVFAFTGEYMEPGIAPNASALNPTTPNSVTARTKSEGYNRQGNNNSVSLPASKTTGVQGAGSPNSIATTPGVAGSSANPVKPRNPEKPIPAANGVGGPWKTLEYQLSYLVEDLADTAGNLVKAEDGDFLDIVSGKLVTAKALTAKIQNFLSAVFTQVVSAVRQSIANLAEQLQLVNLLGGATGVPFIIFTAIQQAVVQILSSLCNIDSNLIGYISDPIGSLTNIVNSFLDGIIDKAAMVLQGVQEIIDSIVCSVNNILDQVLSIVDTVSTIVQGVQQAQEIIEAWKSGSAIFSEGTDLIKNGISSITGLIAMFIKFAAGNCDRTPDGGVDTVGWFPLFGVTHCTPEELEEINKIRGKQRGSCGNNSSGGSLIDNIIAEADPYMTAAKTWINGAYEMYVGTPGRQASLKKDTNGTTHLAVKTNNHEYAKHVAYKKIREENKDLSDEEAQKLADQTAKQNNSGKGDTGNLVANHSTYAGNYTQEIHGDECKTIDNDKVVNVNGDYFLKVTGDMHLEVGGGLFVDAEGAPRVVDKNGEDKNTKIQKHTLKFGSDVDINVVGAKLEAQASEINLASQSTKITGALYENSCSQQSMSGAEIICTGSNSISLITTTLNETINMLSAGIPPAKAGIFRLVKGSVETIMSPAGSAADAVPRYTISNTAGLKAENYGLTSVCDVKGAYTLTVGGVATTKVGGVCSISAGGAMNLIAKGKMIIGAPTIYLN